MTPEPHRPTQTPTVVSQFQPHYMSPRPHRNVLRAGRGSSLPPVLLQHLPLSSDSPDTIPSVQSPRGKARLVGRRRVEGAQVVLIFPKRVVAFVTVSSPSTPHSFFFSSLSLLSSFENVLLGGGFARIPYHFHMLPPQATPQAI